MGLFGGGGKLSKLSHKTGQVTSDIWEHGGKEGLITAGIIAASLYTGGLAAGAAGLIEGGATAAGAATLGSTAGITAASLGGAMAGIQGASTTSARQKQAEAQFQYDVEVNKAAETAARNRRADLLSLRKSLTPSLSKSAQGGQSASASADKTTGGIILG